MFARRPCAGHGFPLGGRPVDRGGRNLQIRDPLVVGAGRLEILFAQLGGAPELPSCQLDLGLPLGELRPGCRERRLIGTRIDYEQ